MLASYAVGLAAIAAIVSAWVGVQCAWRKTIGPPSSDPDALAGRLGCGGRDCAEPCAGGRRDRACSAEEENP